MLKKPGLLFSGCVFGIFMTACDVQKIGDVTADPGRFSGKDIAVAGRVTNMSVGMSLGAMGAGLYQIDDGTGKLYVLSESRGAPAAGTQIGVKGRIMPTLTFMGKNYVTVLREDDRRLVD